ncbi:MAG TPA: tyrosine-type recombinase/integrase [Chloroflexota bacterium]|nr:tyrosine-type recombinase/integrase [Chloroflexota bacterium]
MPTQAPPQSELQRLAVSFSRSLRSANRAETTIKNYNAAITRVDRFLARQGMPRTVSGVRREHLEAFLVVMLAECAPASAANHYRSLQQFFRWLVEEGEIPQSPMARMKPPQVPLTPPPVFSDAELRALFKTCEGKTFAERRDTAILRLLLDSGMRRAELANIRLPDLDLDTQTILVLGKGSRPRHVPIGRKTVQAVDRYVRARTLHPDQDLEWLWLGEKGRLTAWGIAQMVERRAKQACVAHANLHRFRHTAAHQWFSQEGSENGAMQNFGWRSRQMLARYGASAAAERAREEHRRLSPGDRV